MVDKGAKNRDRLTRLLEARVKELQIRWSDVAERSGKSDAIIRRIRNDHSAPVTPAMAAAIDRALHWSPGVSRILDGQDPVDVYAPPAPAPAPAAISSDMDILLHWSHRLSAKDFHQLAGHITTIRLAAYREGRRSGNDDKTGSSDMDILLHWSRLLTPTDFQLLAEHITTIRLAAYREGDSARRDTPAAED